MKLTERQGKLLNVIIKEYIESAQPVSSQLLEKNYDFDISPATIRIEMQKLTDKGFLQQPHTSAGRVPTDKGYRFFVNNLMRSENYQGPATGENHNLIEQKNRNTDEVGEWLKEEFDDNFKFIQSLTKHIAETTKSLTLSYLEKEDFFWTEGWAEVLKEPEFGERDFILNFTNFFKDFEENIEELKTDSDVNVYIGKENSLPKAKDFTVISSRYHLPGGEEGIISILGPKRMEYDRNISLMNSIIKLLE